MKNLISLVVIIFTLVNCQLMKKPATTDTTNQIIIGQIDSVYSNILDESRKIWVHVPESARNGSGENKYPVLYLLDGPDHFYSVTGMIRQLSKVNSILPEMIIVAIPNTNRDRDMTPTHVDSIQYSSGGGDIFLDFVENELIPHIEKTYPAATYRTFVGHSFGGLSVINALIRRPQLFNNYVAIDPSLWWDDQAFLWEADSTLSVNKFEGRALYVGVANTLDAEMKIDAVHLDTTKSSAHIRSILQFVKSIDTKEDNGLVFEWKYYNNDTHNSVALIAEYDALRFLFPWYTFERASQFYDPGSNATADELLELVNSHYENVSDRFGYTVLPAEAFINSAGYGLMRNNMFEKASVFFDLNIQNYPGSSNVYDSRGDCYLAQQDSIKALELFIKALEVGNNIFSQEKIDLLKQKLKN